jgi:hypothetical protein
MIISFILNEMPSFAQQNYDYNVDNGTRFKTDLGRLMFGNSVPISNSNDINIPSRPQIKVGYSTDLKCGQLDIDAFSNVDNYKKMFNDMLHNVEGNLKQMASILPGAAPMLAICYASPTLCAELRHDSFMFNQKLGFQSNACSEVDKFIDDKSDQGSKTLKSESIAKCMRDHASDGSNVAFDECRQMTGLPFRDFQNALDNSQTNSTQKLLDSIVNYQSYITKTSPVYDAYNELLKLEGETNVNSDGTYQKTYPTGVVISPDKLAGKYINSGMNISCDLNSLQNYIDGTNTGDDLFSKNLSFIIRKNMSNNDIYDLNSLPFDDFKIACSALGRSLAKESGTIAVNQMQSSVAIGMSNPAIPEPMKQEVKLETDMNLKALYQSLDSENIPSVKQVQNIIHNLASATRARNQSIAASVSNQIVHGQLQKWKNVDCNDTESCGG